MARKYILYTWKDDHIHGSKHFTIFYIISINGIVAQRYCYDYTINTEQRHSGGDIGETDDQYKHNTSWDKRIITNEKELIVNFPDLFF